MTEKAQRELYLAIRKSCDFAKATSDSLGWEDFEFFFGCLAQNLSDLLTAPQYKLSQLEKFKFLER